MYSTRVEAYEARSELVSVSVYEYGEVIVSGELGENRELGEDGGRGTGISGGLSAKSNPSK